MDNKTLVMVPTYNEHENVVRIIHDIEEELPNVDMLFIDDNSPDATGEILDELKKSRQNLFILHRSGKLGIGSAHMEGINWAYDHGYRLLVTMDCDLTHSPSDIHGFIKNSYDCDIVVGSRYINERSLDGWNIFRKILTRLGHFLTHFFLNMPYDATGAFRLYRLDRIPREFLHLINSRGYSFFFESLFILNFNGYKIKELPIILPKRVYGHSKMRFEDALNSFIQLVHTYFVKSFSKEKLLISKDAIFSIDNRLLLNEDWDQYWSTKKSGVSHILYDAIAIFYRKYIIRPSLDQAIFKNFEQASRLVHAGCGSGQVDGNVRQYANVVALDISPEALSFYSKVNGSDCELIHGSIFEMPIEPQSVDGVYNLGVMEHFNETEINSILSEFNRITKVGGRVVLFWPHQFGSSVLVLKTIHFILNNLLNKNIKLHPDEITRIKSKNHANKILTESGFMLVDYRFDIRDMFTHAIIVGEKLK